MMIAAIIVYCLLGFALGLMTTRVHMALDKKTELNNSGKYSFAIITAIQFVIIGWYAISNIDVALLCLITMCFNFLSINGLREKKYWETGVHGVIFIIVATHGFIHAHAQQNVASIFYYPLIIFIVAFIVKSGAKLFIGMDVFSASEVRVMTISSGMLAYLPFNVLSSYILLVGIFAFIWALFWKIFRKKQELFLLPAIAAALLTCLLFPNVAVIAEHIS